MDIFKLITPSKEPDALIEFDLKSAELEANFDSIEIDAKTWAEAVKELLGKDCEEWELGEKGVVEFIIASGIYLHEKKKLYSQFSGPLSLGRPSDFFVACMKMPGLYESWKQNSSQGLDSEALDQSEEDTRTNNGEDDPSARLKQNLIVIQREFSGQPELMAELRECCVNSYVGAKSRVSNSESE